MHVLRVNTKNGSNIFNNNDPSLNFHVNSNVIFYDQTDHIKYPSCWKSSPRYSIRFEQVSLFIDSKSKQLPSASNIHFQLVKEEEGRTKYKVKWKFVSLLLAELYCLLRAPLLTIVFLPEMKKKDKCK